ncbi:hypothetical protein LTR65_003269 [Meristemomyces frigidus]
MAQFLLDEAIDLTGHAQAAAIQSVFKALSALEERLAGAKWTPRRLAIKVALRGPPMCLRSGVVSSERAAMVSMLAVSRTQEAGSMWWTFWCRSCSGEASTGISPCQWYALESMLMEFRMTTGGTFRENPLATKHLRDDHYGRSFKWPNEGPSQKEEALKQRETSAMVPIPATKESKAEPVKHAPVRPMAAPRAQATYEVR